MKTSSPAAARSSSPVSNARPDLAAALPGWIVARVIVVAATIIGRVVLRRGFHPPINVVLAHTGLMSWDADWYRRIATHGYAALPQRALRFFPLYPLLGRVFSVVFGGRADWALLCLSNVLALVLGALIHRLVLRERGDVKLARRAAWLVALAPPAFVLVMGYSEALFLCLTIVAVMAMRQGRWEWAAAAGLLAGLTRPVGLLLAVPAAFEAMRALRSRRGSGVAPIAAVLAPFAGTGLFCAWVGLRFGSVLLPFEVQEIPGLRGQTQSPLVTIVKAASGVVTGQFGRQLHYPWVLVAVALAVVVLFRWPSSFGAYAAVTVLAAAAAQNLGSFERYAYGAFPILLAGATLTASKRVERVVFVASGALMGAYAVAAFIGAYVP